MKCLINERHLTPKTTFAPISIISTDPHTRRPFHDPIYSTLWAYPYTVPSPLQTYTKKITAQFTPYSPQYSEHRPEALLKRKQVIQWQQITNSTYHTSVERSLKRWNLNKFSKPLLPKSSMAGSSMIFANQTPSPITSSPFPKTSHSPAAGSISYPLTAPPLPLSAPSSPTSCALCQVPNASFVPGKKCKPTSMTS